MVRERSNHPSPLFVFLFFLLFVFLIVGVFCPRSVPPPFHSLCRSFPPNTLRRCTVLSVAVRWGGGGRACRANPSGCLAPRSSLAAPFPSPSRCFGNGNPSPCSSPSPTNGPDSPDAPRFRWTAALTAMASRTARALLTTFPFSIVPFYSTPSLYSTRSLHITQTTLTI